MSLQSPQHDRQSGDASDEQPRDPTQCTAEDELPPLRTGVRILLFAAGALLVLLGLILGPLPGIPAVLLVPLGAALLSLASNRLNLRLRAVVVRRWPGAWLRIQRVRAWLHRRLS